MSAPDLPPLDPDLAELLDAERVRAAPPPEMRVAVSRDLTALLEAKHVPPPRAWTPSKIVQIALVSFAAGGLVGAVGQARLATAPAAVVVPAASPSVAPPAPPPPSTGSAPATTNTVLAHSAEPARPPVVKPTSSTRTADGDLVTEQVLVETARAAVGRGDSTSALAALDRHARIFPNGRLMEEADVLRIQALSQAGRTDDARARAEAFRTRYPRSVFLALLDGVR